MVVPLSEATEPTGGYATESVMHTQCDATLHYNITHVHVIITSKALRYGTCYQ